MCYTKIRIQKGNNMFSNLLSVDSAFRSFLTQLSETLGFAGFLGIFLGIEALFVIIFGIRAGLSYEARAKRTLHKANNWLFANRTITTQNIKEFNNIIKSGPKRLSYYWQQYILYREGDPSKYMTIENIIDKPLKSGGWAGSVKTLSILTCVWAVVALIFGFASQTGEAFGFPFVAVAFSLPCAVLLVGMIAVLIIKGTRTTNLEDLYHIYHLFARFVDNGCAELPQFIDFDLLFTPKEIENGNSQLREYYEARARKAKEEFEKAKQNEVEYISYDFENVGVEGRALLNRAMNLSETFISTRNATLSKIAQAESQKDALRRNYENIQMDLQRKIQASKENIQKLIEQQAATTSRIEVGLLRQQQDKEVKKQEGLQKDYDKEETRYKADRAVLDAEIAELATSLEEGLVATEKGMAAEYHTFYEKVMKSAYAVAEKKTQDEKTAIKKQCDIKEKELVSVQTQIKRLMDENLTLREKLEAFDPQYQQTEGESVQEGHYDDDGNFIYADGSYHSPDGLFHDIDGKIYNMNGQEVTGEYSEEYVTAESVINDQINQFGTFVSTETEEEKTEDVFAESKEESLSTDSEEQYSNLSFEEEIEPATTVEEKDSAVEEAPAEVEETASPARKRGRPRKIVAQEPKVEEPKKSRGRPRKNPIETEKKKTGEPKKSRGRPRKVVESQPKAEEPKKSRGRPRKVAAQEPKIDEPKRSRGRPRKSPVLGEDIESLSKINQLINQEEEKLSKMKALLNSEIDEVLKEETRDVDREREELIKAVEALKAQAAGVSQNPQSDQELAKINERLESLIKEISILNDKK